MEFQIARAILKSPFWSGPLLRLSMRYVSAMGHYQYGLKTDDLLIAETPQMTEALRRLDDTTIYERNYRFKNALQLSLEHKVLPEYMWTNTFEDESYLLNKWEAVNNEEAETQAYDYPKSNPFW
ncbi:hypothetical protein H696_02390 [Fonticula alba]|uniref:Cytochrome b-c1 complex subunit 7 n=1 Tax=Fonticula alba TaxID=691883 RepID=A0A058ZBZ6_FONAL|nr:hypothetical protein H696_02390 [Fonticula alba]KCV71443.1 hypothetical protein H696_02390 [Fonticula alba]|eukprot:XP_009494566.1 hypothetical protein H696_02390 [Fonticula alba]